MADDKPEKTATQQPESARRVKRTSSAQAEFDRYKARMTARAGQTAGPGMGAPAGFAAAPAFSIGGGSPAGYAAGMGAMPAVMVGSPWSAGPLYGAPGFSYGPMHAPPPLPENSLTERLRYTLRLGVDVVNATLAGGLRVLGGISGAAMWGGESVWRHGGHGGCGCGCAHGSTCGCSDCCTTCDPCCHSGVSSCGCGHCC